METFVVRVWTPAERQAAPHPPVLRGEVEHVATGAATTFVGTEQLVTFMARNRAGTHDGHPPTGDGPVSEVLRIAPDIILKDAAPTTDA